MDLETQKKSLGSDLKIRVGRVSGNTQFIFFCLIVMDHSTTTGHFVMSFFLHFHILNFSFNYV